MKVITIALIFIALTNCTRENALLHKALDSHDKNINIQDSVVEENPENYFIETQFNESVIETEGWDFDLDYFENILPETPNKVLSYPEAPETEIAINKQVAETERLNKKRRGNESENRVLTDETIMKYNLLDCLQWSHPIASTSSSNFHEVFFEYNIKEPPKKIAKRNIQYTPPTYKSSILSDDFLET